MIDDDGLVRFFVRSKFKVGIKLTIRPFTNVLCLD
jgi:hypothetical protein